MSDIILETRGLTKRYGGVHALEDANFTLRDGEHIAVVGLEGGQVQHPHTHNGQHRVQQEHHLPPHTPITAPTPLTSSCFLAHICLRTKDCSSKSAAEHASWPLRQEAHMRTVQAASIIIS